MRSSTTHSSGKLGLNTIQGSAFGLVSLEMLRSESSGAENKGGETKTYLLNYIERDAEINKKKCHS